MLKRENRLSNFRKKTKTQNFDSPLFKLKIFSDGENEKKFGFVVSKKIDSRAVVRNATKRVLKKALKNILGEIKNGTSGVIITKKGFYPKDEKTLTDTFYEYFKKAGKLK
jgi:ribonuclease P protein component